MTPLLVSKAPEDTITKRWKEGQKPGYGGNSFALADVKAGLPQVMAWAYDRPDGARGFGFTGLHFHKNLADDSLRTLLVNATAWITKLPVPEGGIQTPTPSRDDLESLIDDGKLAVQRRGI